MGGCCSSGRAEAERVPVYFYCQPVLEHEPYSSNSTVSAMSSGFLVDTNLDMSSPDTYRAPPPPLPYDFGLACSQALPVNLGFNDSKSTTGTPLHSGVSVEATLCDSPQKCVDKIKSSDTKTPNSASLNQYHVSTEEDDIECPICLEDYLVENPRLITKCEHHFHLSCLLEWMERGNSCPICDQGLIFNYAFGK